MTVRSDGRVLKSPLSCHVSECSESDSVPSMPCEVSYHNFDMCMPQDKPGNMYSVL